MRRESGFTLVELLITMAILGFVLAGITQMFTGVLTQFKQQSKIAETSIEGIVGLELLRQDMEDAGFGLPWRIPGTTTYLEASGAVAAAYNDATASPPMNPPRAFVAGSGTGWNGSDVLIIKATNVARNDASQKWTHINSDNVPRTWDVPAEDLAPANSVMVLEPGTSEANRRTLKTDGTVWLATAGSTTNFTPSEGYNFVYGIDDGSTARMPFNRADYYIYSPSDTTVPARCAPNTSVLAKNVINNTTVSGGGYRADNLPLLDCVADMQVVFRRDTNEDGSIDGSADVLPAASLTAAAQIRAQVKEVRVYILAHEGQIDRSYTHPTTDILVGETGIGGGRTFNIGANVNYRWKLYILVVKPKNLQ